MKLLYVKLQSVVLIYCLSSLTWCVNARYAMAYAVGPTHSAQVHARVALYGAHTHTHTLRPRTARTATLNSICAGVAYILLHDYAG